MSITLILLCVFVTLGVIYYLLEKKPRANEEQDETKPLKTKTVDTLPKKLANVKTRNTVVGILVGIAVISLGYYVYKNVFGSHSTGNKGAMRVEHLSPNGLQLTLDRRYLYNFYPDESTVFKSFNHPDGDIVDTLIKNPDNTWRWANQYHNNGWDKWEVSSIEGDHTIQIDSIPRNNIAR